MIQEHTWKGHIVHNDVLPGLCIVGRNDNVVISCTLPGCLLRRRWRGCSCGRCSRCGSCRGGRCRRRRRRCRGQLTRHPDPPGLGSDPVLVVLPEDGEPEEELAVEAAVLGGHPLGRHLVLVLIVSVGDGVVDPLVARDVVGLLRVEGAQNVDVLLLDIFSCLQRKIRSTILSSFGYLSFQ